MLLNRKHTSVFAISCLIALFPALSIAQTAQEKGLEIAIEADKRNLGWKDSTADMKMTLDRKSVV